MQKLTVSDLQSLLVEHDDGVLKRGAHEPDDHAFCAMEFVALVAGEPWTDNPQCVHPALASYCRRLNDSPWPSNQDRTEAMLPLIAEVFGTGDLKISAARVAYEHICQVLPIALEAAAAIHPKQEHKGALTAAAKTCRESTGLSAAESAVNAAWSAAWSAESAAWSAANAAKSAAESAVNAAKSAAESVASAAEGAAKIEVYKTSIAILIAEIKLARTEIADANA